MSRPKQPAAIAQGTTARSRRPTLRGLTSAIAVLALSKHEEEFFRAWDHQPSSEPHDFSDLDDGHQPRTVWRALIGWLYGNARHAE